MRDKAGDGPGNSLDEQAQQFADDLTATVQSVVGTTVDPFMAIAHTVGEDGERTHLAIRQSPVEGIQLTVEGRPMLTLRVSFRCTWDHREDFLAVENSTFHVLATGSKSTSEPLFRVDFLRQPESDVPSAHMHVHAHRDAITHVMDHCGVMSSRAKRRRKKMADGEHIPRLADLHIPLGGARFRPCLEDLLQMLINELGVDAQPGAEKALAAGRTSWRKRQLAASVRDSPETAASVLREQLGYEVRPPEAGPVGDRPSQLGAY